MTRARWFIAGTWLLLFWLIASAVWAPALQFRLEKAASAKIEDIQTGHQPVHIRFNGQTAYVSGKVRHEGERVEILKRIADDVRTSRTFNFDVNPVKDVVNDIEVAPYPSGWLMLAAQGSRSMLLGTLATEYEARDVGRLMQAQWGKDRGHLVPQLKTDAARFDEAPQVQTTLDALPGPRMDRGGDSAQVQIAHLGHRWERITLDAKDEFLRGQLASYPITDSEWNTVVLPALQQVRRYQAAERIRLAEEEHQSKLPPPHVFLAARDQRLLLRGEVASLKIKRELLNTVIITLPGWRVLDDLRVNSQRRAVANFGPITTALLPLSQESKGQKSLVLGLSGLAWQLVDWQVGEAAQPWKDLLPADLPPALLQEDSRMVTQWLQGNAQGIPALPIPAQPSFLTLTLLPDKVILAGQLAEEALRTRLIDAARRAYSGRAVLFSEALLVRGTCEPTAEVEQTVRSLPPLPQGQQAPILAFARPGQVWKSLPATEPLTAPGALAKSGLMPAGFPAAMAEDTFAAEAYDHLRHHWRQPAPPLPEKTTR